MPNQGLESRCRCGKSVSGTTSLVRHGVRVNGVLEPPSCGRGRLRRHGGCEAAKAQGVRRACMPEEEGHQGLGHRGGGAGVGVDQELAARRAVVEAAAAAAARTPRVAAAKRRWGGWGA